MKGGEQRGEVKGDASADIDAILSALSVRSRRVVLAELAAASGRVAAVTLAHRLVVSEAGPAEARTAYLELYHTHGPVLELAGLLEWDRTTAEVHLTPTGQEAAALFVRPPDSE